MLFVLEMILGTCTTSLKLKMQSEYEEKHKTLQTAPLMQGLCLSVRCKLRRATGWPELFMGLSPSLGISVIIGSGGFLFGHYHGCSMPRKCRKIQDYIAQCAVLYSTIVLWSKYSPVSTNLIRICLSFFGWKENK